MHRFRPFEARSLWIGLLLLAIGLPAAGAIIGGGDRKTEAPFDITADTVEYESDRDLYVARGNVVITQPGRSLTADWVAISSETRQGIATGNVVLTEAEDILYAEALSFEIDTSQGIVIQGFLDARETGFEITGETIHKTGEQTYVFDQGTFTTCRCPDEGRDPWKIRAKEAEIEVGGYATTRNTSFDVLGFPVIWLPWMRYPVKTERETGFLLPEFSISGRSGTEIGLPFFWAARPNLNVTVTPIYLFERGFKPNLDIEYVFGERSYGSLFGTIIDDQDVDPDDLDTPFDELRWATEWIHDQFLPYGWRAKVDATLFSDNLFAYDFDELSAYKDTRFLQSRAFLERRFGPLQRYGFNGGIWWADDLQNPDDQDRDDFLLHRLPNLQLSGMPQPLPGFARRLQFSFGMDYTNFYSRNDAEDVYPFAQVRGDDVFLDTGIDAIPDGEERDEDGNIFTLDGNVITADGAVLTAAEFLAGFPPGEAPELTTDGSRDNFPLGTENDFRFQEGEPLGDRGHRLVMNPRIGIPFRVADTVEVLPEIGYHGTFYSSRAQSSVMRSLFTAMLDARIRTRREVELPFGLGRAVHLMEPRLVYTGVTSTSQSDNPLFVPAAAQPQERIRQFELFNLTRNPADRIDSVNAITAGLGNRFYVPGVEGEPPELFADISLSTQYDFASDDNSKFFAEGILYPYENLRLAFNMGFDFNEVEFSEGLLEARYWTEEGNDFAITYRYLRDIPLFYEAFAGDDNRYEDFEPDVTKVNQLTLRGRLAVNRNWALTYRLRYSFEGSEFLSNWGGVEYISKCRCWAIRLELGTDRSGGARFDVQYVLIGLGDDAVRPFSGARGRATRDPFAGAAN